MNTIPRNTSSSLDQIPLHCLRNVWEEYLSSKDQAIFFCRLVLKTIDAYLSKNYSAFDAHTTTNCCHGIALLGKKLVLEVRDLDLLALQKQAEEKISELENLSKASDFCTNWVPKSLIKLASLYLLSMTREISKRRQKTEARNLKKISPIGSRFCWSITNELKKNISNLVAFKYKDYLEQLCPNTNINGAPIHLWGNYIQPKYIRTDKANSHYASCIFSIQVALAYLIKTKAKIALVNDIIGADGSLQDRYIRLFEGDGSNRFNVLPENMDLISSDPSEPVVIFSGYVYSDTLKIETLSQALDPWLEKFPCLMLACDIFYPQFPGVRDDPDFDSSPIDPQEELLKELFSSHAQIEGVSHLDPSLFCAAHIYLCSLNQIKKSVQNKDFSALPDCLHGLAPSLSLQKS